MTLAGFLSIMVIFLVAIFIKATIDFEKQLKREEINITDKIDKLRTLAIHANDLGTIAAVRIQLDTLVDGNQRHFTKKQEDSLLFIYGYLLGKEHSLQLNTKR